MNRLIVRKHHIGLRQPGFPRSRGKPLEILKWGYYRTNRMDALQLSDPSPRDRFLKKKCGNSRREDRGAEGCGVWEGVSPSALGEGSKEGLCNGQVSM